MIPLTRTAPQGLQKRRFPDQPFYYQVRIDEALDPKWVSWFDGLELSLDGNQTILTGWMPDQAALFGVIDRIRDLGLLLLSVERLKPNP